MITLLLPTRDINRSIKSYFLYLDIKVKIIKLLYSSASYIAKLCKQHMFRNCTGKSLH